MSGCIRGARYKDELDAKIGRVEKAKQGVKVSGYYFCNKCAGFHLGSAKSKVKKCWATAKVEYHTPDEARESLRHLQDKGRSEIGFYKCKYCSQYHVTSNSSGAGNDRSRSRNMRATPTQLARRQ